MANITLLDIEELKKTKLKPYIETSLEHRAPDPGFHAVMGHNLDLAEVMFRLGTRCSITARSRMPSRKSCGSSCRGLRPAAIEAMSGLLRRSDRD